MCAGNTHAGDVATNHVNDDSSTAQFTDLTHATILYYGPWAAVLILCLDYNDFCWHEAADTMTHAKRARWLLARRYELPESKGNDDERWSTMQIVRPKNKFQLQTPTVVCARLKMRANVVG